MKDQLHDMCFIVPFTSTKIHPFTQLDDSSKGTFKQRLFEINPRNKSIGINFIETSILVTECKILLH